VDESLPDTLAAYTDAMKAAGNSRDTVRSRLTGVRLLARSADTDPRTCTAEQITSWLAGDLAPWTRLTYYSHARAWFGFLLDTDRRIDDPTRRIRVPKKPRGIPQPLPANDVTVLLEVAKGHPRSFLLLGVYAGLRAHEIAKVRGVDVSATGIRVVGKGGYVAVVPTHPLIWEDAQNYPRDMRFWFPGNLGSQSPHIQAATVTRAVKQVMVACGVQGHTHMLRHRFGTDAYAVDHDILVTQQLLRHASPATTAGYALVESDRLRATVLRLGRQTDERPA
jgi:integrase